MRAGLEVIDADRHVIEPADLWQDAAQALGHELSWVADAPPEETGKARSARLGRLAHLWPPALPRLDGEGIYGPMAERTQLVMVEESLRRAADVRAARTPEGMLGSMDRGGVDIAVLLPTLGLFLTAIDGMDPRLSAEFAHRYNVWLSGWRSVDPTRLRPAGLLPRHDPTAMMRELEWVLDAGWRAVVLRPEPVAGRPLGHPDLEPLWRRCADEGIAVLLHGATHARLSTVGADRYQSRFGLHASAHPLELMLAFLSLVEAGILVRHPALRFALLEGGASWLPFWLTRLDQLAASHLGAELPDALAVPPSAQFRRQGFVALEPDEPGLELLLSTVGDQCLLVGTDFPHVDHDADLLPRLWTQLSPATLQAATWDNPARLHRLV